jgi:hypothetical protein
MLRWRECPMNIESFILSASEAVNLLYVRCYNDIWIASALAFIALIYMTNLGILRSALIVIGGVVLFSLYGPLITVVANPMTGFFLALTMLAVGSMAIYHLQKGMAA